jgi:hypothetical protein
MDPRENDRTGAPSPVPARPARVARTVLAVLVSLLFVTATALQGTAEARGGGGHGGGGKGARINVNKGHGGGHNKVNVKNNNVKVTNKKTVNKGSPPKTQGGHHGNNNKGHDNRGNHGHHGNNNHHNYNHDVYHHYNNNYRYDYGWGGAVAAGVAVGVTAAAIGSVAYTLPAGCSSVVVNGVVYQQCGNTWYQPQYYGNSMSYTVVARP